MKQYIATVAVFAVTLSITPVQTKAAQRQTASDHIYVETNYSCYLG